ncbi:nucleoside-diphosphate sugar epimerase/dehydratase [uncultured Jannaschia sp.]|uniref:polysaccharide biosynthesis protein n=1 Tax=uncultured Jannaschia sp. TaxID=293347 RepID=UPI0026019021|nr:nucleoside-diphosphate sugar epimerase/dehydratase [uncultured Jannaschia sp.]
MIFLVMDGLLVPLSLYLAHALRYGTATPPLDGGAPYLLLATALGLVIVTVLRLPWIKLNALEAHAIIKIALAAGAIAIGMATLSFMLQAGSPRSVPAMTGALFFCFTILGRLAAIILLETFWPPAVAEPVAIYGAGRAGIQLAAALRQSQEARPVLFVDDDPGLSGLLIAGLPVYPAKRLPSLVESHDLRRVLLAMPSVPDEVRREILERLEPLPIRTQVLPSYVEIMAGTDDDTLRTVEPGALLGRDQVNLDTPEIAAAYSGKVVMVTGAGGSIGSELCRQLVTCGPAAIILFDHSEHALYDAHRDLVSLAARHGVRIAPRLGSVTDAETLARVLAREGVQIMLHAAAYKHVPLVEENALVGGANNIIGTRIAAEAAAQAGVERFILVSTDKAVRPTNVMGATKRLAELVVQDLQPRHPATKFAMVRFGNVLGSSGSVLPLFAEQIRAGGPVTVTHPDVTRFFMTIAEAARLVLLASAFAQGRDLFVLDMGEPQKILDIALRMIALSGRKPIDPETGQGDIEIRITGLRPGEKLYEELLIDDASLRSTPHPKILRAEEAGLTEGAICGMLDALSTAIHDGRPDVLRALLSEYVEGYAPPRTTPLETARADPMRKPAA